MRTRGLFIGREHRGKGVNVALGPVMNMGRVAQGGRNWEGFGADPFLTGEAAYETIMGMQQGGVMACAKHLIGKSVWLPLQRLKFLHVAFVVNRNITVPHTVQTSMIEHCMKYMRSLS